MFVTEMDIELQDVIRNQSQRTKNLSIFNIILIINVFSWKNMLYITCLTTCVEGDCIGQKRIFSKKF